MAEEALAGRGTAAALATCPLLAGLEKRHFWPLLTPPTSSAAEALAPLGSSWNPEILTHAALAHDELPPRLSFSQTHNID